MIDGGVWRNRCESDGDEKKNDDENDDDDDDGENYRVWYKRVIVLATLVKEITSLTWPLR